MKTKLPSLPKTGERRLLKLIAFWDKKLRQNFSSRADWDFALGIALAVFIYTLAHKIWDQIK